MSHRRALAAPFLMPRIRTMEAELSLAPRIEGHVTVELIHARTGLVKRRLQFRNLIVDAGLLGIFAGSVVNLGSFTANGYMGLGTGGTAPTTAQTNLVAQLSPLDRSNTNATGFGDTYGWGAGNAYRYLRMSRFWTETLANGTLAEMGLFNAATGGTMFMRQLFKDAGGNPTTITKTSADQLRIVYELRVYPPTVDATGTLTINAINYDWTVRPLNVGGADWNNYLNGFQVHNQSFSSWARESNTLELATANFTGTARSSQTIQAHGAGNKYRDQEAWWEPGVANFATGIGAIAVAASTGAVPLWQVRFATKLPKDSTKRLKLMLRFGLTQYP